jgi:hypothetical protein
MTHAPGAVDTSAGVRPTGPHQSPSVRAAPPPVRPLDAGIRVAALFADDRLHEALEALAQLARRLGVPLDARAIPASLARSCSVGRIGVARDAAQIVAQQGVLIGTTFGGDPLAPVARLFRGLQRRAGVVVDVRPVVTLAGSIVAGTAYERDVLLFAQRSAERPAAGTTEADSDHSRQRTYARDAAMLAYRMCVAERRRLMLVQPVGRGTRAQRLLVDALQLHAATHRLPPPRVIKAGVLAALLSGELGRERWLVASVMPIDELSEMLRATLGEMVAWPVVSYGRSASFYDLPVTAVDDPVPVLLVLVSLLMRSGRRELALQLQSAVLTTSHARTRMAEELGVTQLRVPFDAFVNGVLANWGREPIAPPPRERRAAERDTHAGAAPPRTDEGRRGFSRRVASAPHAQSR